MDDVDYTVDTLVEFAKAFADDPDDVHIQRESHIIFQQGGSRRRLRFDPETNQVVGRSKTRDSVPSYFAQIARLPHLASRQAQELRSSTSEYVPVPSTLQEQPSENAVTHIAEWCDSILESEDTGLLFVTGAAGSGKSTALKAFAGKRSAEYSERTKGLPLYINAQGSALSTLKNVVAGRLNELRASHVYYESFVVLCRLGLIIPIIDGFDELLVEAGVSDSFKSLGGLLQDLKEDGAVIASSRREYYLSQNLHNQAKFYQSLGGQRIQPVELELGQMKRAGGEKLIEKVTGCDQARAADIYTSISDADETGLLTSRPFLLRAVCEAAVSPETHELKPLPQHFKAGRGREWSLLREVGSQFLRREAQKWPSRSISEKDAFEYQWKVLEHVAEELWSSGKQSISTEAVKIFAEELLPPDLSLEARHQLLDRWDAHAYLVSTNTSLHVTTEREFIHSSFRYIFLGSALAKLIIQQTTKASGYCGPLRQAFNDDVVGVILDSLASSNDIQSLHECAPNLDHITHPMWRQNLSTLVLQSMAITESQGLRVTGAVAQSIDWKGLELHDVTLLDCTIIGLDIRDCKLSGCHLESCAITELDVSAQTRFIRCTPISVRVTAMVSWKGAAKKLLRDPADIDTLIEELGLEVQAEQPTQSIEERFGQVGTAAASVLAQLEERPFIRPNDLEQQWTRGRKRFLQAALEALDRAGFIVQLVRGKSDKSPLYVLAEGVSISRFWEAARSGKPEISQDSPEAMAWIEIARAFSKTHP